MYIPNPKASQLGSIGFSGDRKHTQTEKSQKIKIVDMRFQWLRVVYEKKGLSWTNLIRHF